MIEYNVRENTQTNDNEIKINFGECEECLKYDPSDIFFRVCDPRSNEKVIISLDDINYMIRALEKLKEISKDDKVND